MNERTRRRSRLGILILALSVLLSAAVVLISVAPLASCPLCEKRGQVIAGYRPQWYGGCEDCAGSGRVPLFNPRAFSPGLHR